jgi:hypothetical protein
MAITFVEKSNFGKNIATLSLIVAAVAAAGFLGWNFLRDSLAVPPVAVVENAGINKKILEDPVLATLEIFPQIPAPEIETPSQNPFVEQSAIATTTAAVTISAPAALPEADAAQ